MNPYLKGIQEDLDTLFEMMSHDALKYQKWANDYKRYDHAFSTIPEHELFKGMAKRIEEYKEILKPLLP